MPRTRSLAWSELKIGILTVAAILIAALLIIALTGERGLFWQRYRLKTRFSNVAGLKAGSPVRLAGVEIGSVKQLDFSGAQVEVLLEVAENMRPRITSRSVAYLGSISLLGESAVDLTAATEGDPVPDGGFVPQGRGPAQISDVAEGATNSLGEATKLLKDMREGRGTIGKLFTDDRLFRELDRFVTTAEEVTRNMNNGKGTIGKLLNDPKAAEALEASLKNMEAITRQINAGEGSLGRLLKDESFAKSLSGATDKVDTLAGRLNRGEGTAGKLLTDASLFNRLNSVSDRLDLLVTHLNEGQGTAGQLLKDKQLYENMNGAVNELRSLITDIRRDPKKFLNVKVSLF